MKRGGRTCYVELLEVDPGLRFDHTAADCCRRQRFRLPAASMLATFPVLADFAAAVGGDLATVKSLVPFEVILTIGNRHPKTPRWWPTPMVFCNGLGLETWEPAVENAATDRVMIITLSEGLPAFPYHGGDSVEDAHGHSHGTYDLTCGWMSPTPWSTSSGSRKFWTADPENSAVYRSRSEKYPSSWPNWISG